MLLGHLIVELKFKVNLPFVNTESHLFDCLQYYGLFGWQLQLLLGFCAKQCVHYQALQSLEKEIFNHSGLPSIGHSLNLNQRRTGPAHMSSTNVLMHSKFLKSIRIEVHLQYLV